MTVSKSMRYQVLRRDKHTCRYCGRTPPEVRLTIDHVIPEALGGADIPANLVTACADCNGGKSATPPDAALVADVDDSALRWAAAMSAARDAVQADRQRRDQVRDAFLAAWNRWTYTDKAGKNHTFDLPNGWPTTIDQLTAAGLNLADIGDSIDIAMRAEKVKDEFKYFCGVAWNLARKLQETARAIADGELKAEGDPPVRYDFVFLACPHCQGDFQICLETDTVDLDTPPRIIQSGPIKRGDPAELTEGDPRWGELYSRWQEIVGPDLVKHAIPDALRNGELLVLTETTAWADHMSLLAPILSTRINMVLGEEIVTEVTVRRTA